MRGQAHGTGVCPARNCPLSRRRRYKLSLHRSGGILHNFGSVSVRCDASDKRDASNASIDDLDTGTQDYVFEREKSGKLADTLLLRDEVGTLARESTGKDAAGLRSTPMGSAVQNATDRYSLPRPTLAVRNLIEGAQYAHLCTNMANMHHRRAGYPFGMLVDFAADGAGYPIFCLSPLAIHSHNLNEDPRCSLVVQMPGWLGLSNARVTIFGDVYELPAEMQDVARDVFLHKHQAGGQKGLVISESFRFYRMMLVHDIYFVGGFGTMQWIDVADYTATKPDSIVLYHAHETIELLSDRFGRRLAEKFALDAEADGHSSGEESVTGTESDDASVISIDARGMDVRVRHCWETTMHRLTFPFSVHTPDEALRAVEAALSV